MPRLALGIGLLGALTVLVKEAMLVFMLLMAVALLLHHKPFSRSVVRLILPLAAGGLIGMAPWIVRNALVQHAFVPVRTGYGVTMWLANHHGATGTSRTYNGVDILYTMDPAYMAELDARLPADEQDRDKVYLREVARFVRTYPLEYVQLCARRIQYYLWFDPTHPIARNLVYRIGYVLLLLAAIPGAIWAWRRRALDPLIPLVYFGYLVFYAPVLVLPRYRIIPVLILLLLASLTVDRLLAMWRARGTPCRRNAGRDTFTLPTMSHASRFPPTLRNAGC